MNKNKHVRVSTMEELREYFANIELKPRDPARIPKLLKLLKKYWTQPNHTDLRLGQIIGNFCPEMNPYHFEDDELIKALEIAIKDEKSH